VGKRDKCSRGEGSNRSTSVYLKRNSPGGCRAATLELGYTSAPQKERIWRTRRACLGCRANRGNLKHWCEESGGAGTCLEGRKPSRGKPHDVRLVKNGNERREKAQRAALETAASHSEVNADEINNSREKRGTPLRAAISFFQG